MTDKKMLDIREAAEFLGVSIDTLRRWDKASKLTAIRADGKGTHRFYQKSELEMFLTNPFSLGKKWAFNTNPSEPSKEFYCPDISIFQARLSRLESELMKIHDLENTYSLITSIAGEIGNNSFDHNLGTWPDIKGIFFSYDLRKRMVVLADRGRGILETLKRVRPSLKDHLSALKVAFTEVITGRAPELRGNGLKYVKSAVSQAPINLIFQTGNARLELRTHSGEIHLKKDEHSFHGCIALIKF